MSTSPSTSANRHSPAQRALAFWRAQLHAAGGTVPAATLQHARQALLLAARQGAPAQPLIELAVALHDHLMGRGWVRTWARDLQTLLELRPDLPQTAPALWDRLAAAWIAAGEWHQARASLQRSDRTPLGRSLYRQGSLLWMQGQWQAAWRVAWQAWRLLPQEHAIGRVAVAALLLLSAWRLGRYRQAQHWGQRALRWCPSDELLWQGRLHHYLMLTTLPRDLAAAQQHLHLADAYLLAAGGALQRAHLWADATDLYLALGQRGPAEQALAQSYDLWRDIEDPAGHADYFRHAAVVAWALGKPALAGDYAAYAAEQWQALGVEPEVRRCQALLQRVRA